MMRFVPTPSGGVGQPPKPARRMPLPGCRNDHRNPEKAGDCNCADLASEAAEAEAVAAMEAAGPCHSTLDRCDQFASAAEGAGAGYACSTHSTYVRPHARGIVGRDWRNAAAFANDCLVARTKPCAECGRLSGHYALCGIGEPLNSVRVGHDEACESTWDGVAFTYTACACRERRAR